MAKPAMRAFLKRKTRRAADPRSHHLHDPAYHIGRGRGGEFQQAATSHLAFLAGEIAERTANDTGDTETRRARGNRRAFHPDRLAVPALGESQPPRPPA